MSEPSLQFSPERQPFWTRWRLAAFAFGWILVLVRFSSTWRNFPTDFRDTDDAMRLAEVRDYVGGQGWFDLHQYRLDPPAEFPMHWSRLIDWPIAQLIRLARLVVEPATAEAIAMLVWPALVLIPCMLLVMGLTRRLAAGSAVLLALFFALTNPQLVGQFTNGRIDHHNVQLTLTLALLLALASDERRWHGVLAGLAASVMLAVGMETLPFVIIGAGYCALGFVFGFLTARSVIGFGVALAAGTAALFVATLPSSEWLAGACDALSANYLLLAVVGGGGLAVLARVGQGWSVSMKLAALAVLAAVCVVAFAAPEPRCLKGPFGLVDPIARDVWLDHVSEVQPWWTQVKTEPQMAWSALYQPVLALVAIIVLGLGSPLRRRPGFWLHALAAVVALGIGLVQFRTFFYANVLAVPLVAALVATIAGRIAARGGSEIIAATIGALLGGSIFALIVHGFAQKLSGGTTTASSTAADMACYSARTYAPLAALPAGLVLAPVNIGPVILVATPHSVVEAPYHRQQRGIIAAAGMLQAAPEAVLTLMQARGVRYVAICDGDRNADGHKDGISARMLRGEPVPGLEEVPAGQGLRIFKVPQA